MVFEFWPGQVDGYIVYSNCGGPSLLNILVRSFSCHSVSFVVYVYMHSNLNCLLVQTSDEILENVPFR